MSRFEALDAHLRKEAIFPIKEENLVFHGGVRKEFDLLLTTIDGVVEEYYRLIVQPRIGLIRVPKEEGAHLEHGSRFTVVTNVIAKRNPPYRVDEIYDGYFRPGSVGPNSWHPNVALQVRTDLRSMKKEGSQTNTDNLADISVSVWGRLPQIVKDSRFRIERKEAYDKNYTTISFTPDRNDPITTQDTLVTILTIVTSNVLGHETLVREDKKIHPVRKPIENLQTGF